MYKIITGDISGALVIDARDAAEYAEHHIPGAVNLPVREVLDSSLDGLPNLAAARGVSSKPVVIYDDSFGVAAARVAWGLEYTGHPDAGLLDCTYTDWLKKGMRGDDAVPQASPAGYETKLKPDMIATARDIEVATESTVVVDTRRRLDFLQQHVTGAVTIPHRALSEPGTILRSGEDLRRLFANRHIRTNTILYDEGSGMSSALTFYALKYAGLGRVRICFDDWKTLPTESQMNAAYSDLVA